MAKNNVCYLIVAENTCVLQKNVFQINNDNFIDNKRIMLILSK